MAQVRCANFEADSTVAAAPTCCDSVPGLPMSLRNGSKQCAPSHQGLLLDVQLQAADDWLEDGAVFLGCSHSVSCRSLSQHLLEDTMQSSICTCSIHSDSSISKELDSCIQDQQAWDQSKEHRLRLHAALSKGNLADKHLSTRRTFSKLTWRGAEALSRRRPRPRGPSCRDLVACFRHNWCDSTVRSS